MKLIAERRNKKIYKDVNTLVKAVSYTHLTLPTM